MGQLVSTAKTTVIVSTIVLFIAWITVALRFYVRWVTKVGIAADDWWILSGICTAFVVGTTYLYGITKDPDGGANMDRDMPGFDFAAHTTYMKVSYSIAMMYFTLITTVKISILLMYRRIFPVEVFRIQALILGAIVGCWWLSGTVATAVYCVPLDTYWVGPSTGGYCWNYDIFWMVMGATETVIDTAILLLPVRMVWPLQLSIQNKIFVIGIFLLGGFVVITGIARTIYGYAPHSATVDYEHGELWSCIHVGTAIICACLPTLRPLFVFGSRLNGTFRRSYYGSGTKRTAWLHQRRSNQGSPCGQLQARAPPRIIHTVSHSGGLSITLDSDDFDHKPSSTERIVVEETVDVEWSHSEDPLARDEPGLTALPKAHCG